MATHLDNDSHSGDNYLSHHTPPTPQPVHSPRKAEGEEDKELCVPDTLSTSDVVGCRVPPHPMRHVLVKLPRVAGEIAGSHPAR